jgi:ABC-type sugar transport system substrate-binding protein
MTRSSRRQQERALAAASRRARAAWEDRVIGTWRIAAALALGVGGAALCSGAGAADLNGKTIGVIALYDNPFWADARRGIHEVADPLGIKIIALNSGGDAATQATNITNVISAQADAAIVGPVAPAGAVADLKRLKNAGVTTYCLDSCAPEDQAKDLAIGWVTTSGTDLGKGAGTAAAKYIQDKLGGKATIAMVVCDSLGPVCSLRHDAITAALKGVPGATVVATQDAFQTEKAEPKVVDMLTAHPEVNMVIANNQGATEGAVAAVKQLGLAGKVVVFGIDMTNVTARDLLDDKQILMYTVAQNSYEEGKIAARQVIASWSGKPLGEFKVVIPVEEFVRGDTSAIRKYMDDHKGS